MSENAAEKGIANERKDFPYASQRRYAIVAARFNDFVVDVMVQGARQALAECGVDADRVHVCRVPGAFELPLGVQSVIDRLEVAGVIALGAVIRGDTPHFDYVCAEAARGINDVSLRSGLPVAFGVLTTNTIDQATERADPARGNKGAESALAVLEMVELIQNLANSD